MKRAISFILLSTVASILGCGGMMNPPPPLTYFQPLEKPFPHNLAIGGFEDKSFARYPLFITSHDLQDLIQDELYKNRVFREVFAVSIDRKDDAASIDDKALQGKANLILEGEISESRCRFAGSNALAAPAYLLVGTLIALPVGFNIKAQTWEGEAELIYRIREIKTERILLSRRVNAKGYRNFSIWEERTERQLNKNYIRRAMTPLVLQTLKSALTKDICDNFKE